MEFADQWNWVFLAYAFCYTVLVTYVVSIAARISRSRKRLGEES
ncbi:MAG: hypothetical protein QNJ71_05155 [Acidimicrobiia bacterium]|nr:hypothetical protein [Acidimicrobiia bacterium]